MWGQIIITPPRWCSVNNYVRAGAWHPSEIRAPFLCFVTIPPRLSTTTYSRFLCSGTWSSRTTSLYQSLSPDWQHLPQIVSSQLSPRFVATHGPAAADCWTMPPTLSKSQKFSHEDGTGTRLWSHISTNTMLLKRQSSSRSLEYKRSSSRMAKMQWARLSV